MPTYCVSLHLSSQGTTIALTTTDSTTTYSIRGTDTVDTIYNIVVIVDKNYNGRIVVDLDETFKDIKATVFFEFTFIIIYFLDIFFFLLFYPYKR